MQANVKEILTVAESLNVFTSIKDRPEVGKDDFPCFMILDRMKANPEAVDTGLTQYNGAWEYQCLIGVDFDEDAVDDEDYSGSDFVNLESKQDAFFKAMFGGGEWELVAGPSQGAYVISGNELLGSAFTLDKLGIDRY